MATFDVHEARTNLSDLVDAAERGEGVYITRRGGAVTRFALVPAPRAELFGALRGRIVRSEDYDTADAEIAALFDES